MVITPAFLNRDVNLSELRQGVFVECIDVVLARHVADARNRVCASIAELLRHRVHAWLIRGKDEVGTLVGKALCYALANASARTGYHYGSFFESLHLITFESSKLVVPPSCASPNPRRA
jgi:hypothetical protein